jgi:speckle-type POZ protein
LESLDVETVAAMLALADQQNCRLLKDAAIDFIVCSSDTWDGVAASQGFGNLKRSCLSIMVDILDRAVKSRKIWLTIMVICLWMMLNVSFLYSYYFFMS